MIDVDNEAKVYAEKWPEILTLALEAMEKREFRNRLSGCLVLADLVPNREWDDIKPKFRELFTGALSLWGDDMETVRNASRDLSKALKNLILRYANLYSNDNLEQLKEVMQAVMPVVQGEVIHSQITDVKLYGINMLLQIIKSSTQERLYTMDKQERQLAFSYNSEETMRQVLQPYLGRVVLDLIQNLGLMSQQFKRLNMLEQYAIHRGLL